MMILERPMFISWHFHSNAHAQRPCLYVITSGAIQYGVPIPVLLLPMVFSTTADIPERWEGLQHTGA